MWKIALVGTLGLIAAWIIYRQLTAKSVPAATAHELPKKVESAETPAVVYELEDKDLESFTSGGEPTIVLFYAPWCGYCKKMMPEFAKAASAKSKCKRWGQVDATKYDALAKQFKVEAFPTTIVFDRGQVKEVVPGAQSADALVTLVH